MSQADSYWSLFLQTGQPVFYTLFANLREREAEALRDQAEKSA